jgi:hypothetical protein
VIPRRRLGAALLALALASAASAVSARHPEQFGPGGGGGRGPQTSVQAECGIAGRVTLQGRDDHSGTEIYAGDEAVATTDAGGDFAFRTAGGGTLTAVHPGYLVAAGTFTCASPPASTSLVAGDLDGDDSIGLFDLVIVSRAHGSCAQEDTFDARADMNGTGCVDLLDLVLLGRNYRTDGPMPWSPRTSSSTFSGDVLPALQNRCAGCHGVAAGLALGSYAEVMAGGMNGPAVVPGSPDESSLYLRLLGRGGLRMPPSGEPLPDATIAAVRAWIAAGAPDN